MDQYLKNEVNSHYVNYDNNGDDQKYSDLCSVNDDFFLAYSSLSGAYGVFLKKYNNYVENLKKKK